MEGNKLLLIEIANFSKYVQSRKAILGLTNRKFSEKTGVSSGEISKIINGNKKGVSLHSFYYLAVKSGDTIENVRDFVYPHRSFELNKVPPTIKVKKGRTNFGQYMKEHFENETVDFVDDENGFEKIQAKTGIAEQRLKDIYFNTGAPEPYEFLLIEKAVGKEPGEMMKDYVEKYPSKRN